MPCSISYHVQQIIFDIPSCHSAKTFSIIFFILLLPASPPFQPSHCLDKFQLTLCITCLSSVKCLLLIEYNLFTFVIWALGLFAWVIGTDVSAVHVLLIDINKSYLKFMIYNLNCNSHEHHKQTV